MKIKVKVEGMHCHGCERLINMTLEENPLIEEVTSSHLDGIVKITARDGLDVRKEVLDVIAGLGYTPVSYEEIA